MAVLSAVRLGSPRRAHGGVRRRLLRRPTLAALVFVLGCAPLLAQRAARDQDVKATFLFHFCSFVQWPDTAFANPNAPLVIGILGPDPFGTFLDELVKGERVQSCPIEVRRFARVEDARAAHVLYIGNADAPDLGAVLAALRGWPVLTVGESRRRAFVSRGGMIGFVKEHDRLRLRINLDEARAAGLTLNSKLLRLAEIVRTQP